MADLYRKNLESERRKLWGICRLKGLKPDTPERLRIAEIDRLLAQHQAKAPQPPVEREEGSAS